MKKHKYFAKICGKNSSLFCREAIWLISASFVILPVLSSCKSQMVDSKRVDETLSVTPQVAPQVTPAKNSVVDMEPQRGILLKSLENLENSNPMDDLEKSIGKGDLRFIGYKGFTVIVPGVPQGKSNAYVQENGINIIPGTSDVIRLEDDIRLKKVISSYVEPYNKGLFSYLNDKKVKQ